MRTQGFLPLQDSFEGKIRFTNKNTSAFLQQYAKSHSRKKEPATALTPPSLPPVDEPETTSNDNDAQSVCHSSSGAGLSQTSQKSKEFKVAALTLKPEQEQDITNWYKENEFLYRTKKAYYKQRKKSKGLPRIG